MVDAVVAEPRRLAEPMHALPVLLEADRPQVLADSSEAMDVTIADIAPVDELDSELERTLRGANEVVLVDLEQLIEGPDVRDRRLSDTDGPDFVGLDEHDAITASQDFRQCGRAHPAGRASADDHDVLDQPVVHGVGPNSRACADCSNSR